jgi:hypothetical protein
MRWMRRWLQGKEEAPVEAETPVFKEQELWCTPGGQVLADLKGKSVFDFIAARSRELGLGRRPLERDALRRPQPSFEVGTFQAMNVGPIASPAPNLFVQRMAWKFESGLTLPGLKYSHPDPFHKSVLVLAGQDRREASRGWASRGNQGILVELPGTGETAPDEKPGPFGKEWKEAFLAIHLGRSLFNLRVDCARAILGRDTPWDLLVGTGDGGPVALLAGLLEPKVKEVVLEATVLSWSSVAQASQSRNQLASVVPGVLAFDDLPDLAAALAPRPLTIRNPVDPMGQPVTQAELEEAYAKAREAYKAAGAEKNLVLEAKP